ncbi:hypothetical protein [Halosimplex halophilum]|uniref:hypothetical protein n=1 Tax=Halosimplex halophilum TaxID=2559572 RepID=UPI001FE36794|nr:hypothetical protein [Halosimplex halophilum]
MSPFDRRMFADSFERGETGHLVRFVGDCPQIEVKERPAQRREHFRLDGSFSCARS